MGMMDADDRSLFTVEEVAYRASISVALLYKMMAAGRLTFIKIGRARRIPREALMALLQGTGA